MKPSENLVSEVQGEVGKCKDLGATDTWRLIPGQCKPEFFHFCGIILLGSSQSVESFAHSRMSFERLLSY